VSYRRLLPSLIAFALVALPVQSAEKTFADYWSEANGKPGKQVKEFPTVIVVMTDDEVYYFTKPGRPEHPGVITRRIVNTGHSAEMETDGHSFGPDSAQPAFKAWMNNPWSPSPADR